MKADEQQSSKTCERDAGRTCYWSREPCEHACSMSPDRTARFVFHFKIAMNQTEPFSNHHANCRAAWELATWLTHDRGRFYESPEQRWRELTKTLVRHAQDIDPSELQAALMMFAEAMRAKGFTSEAVTEHVASSGTNASTPQEARYYAQKRLECVAGTSTLVNTVERIQRDVSAVRKEVDETAKRYANMTDEDKRGHMRRLFDRSVVSNDNKSKRNEVGLIF